MRKNTFFALAKITFMYLLKPISLTEEGWQLNRVSDVVFLKFLCVIIITRGIYIKPILT